MMNIILGQPQIPLMPKTINDLNRWNILSLRPSPVKPVSQSSLEKKPAISWSGLLLVVILHVALLLLVLHTWQVDEIEPKPELPMMVSLLDAPQSIEPPQKIEAPKMEPVKQKPVEKPVVEKKQQIPVTIAPSPLKPVAETVNPTKPEIAVAESKSDVESHDADSKSHETSEKVVQKEEKDVIEPPQFGVAYLNNPAPAYPGMSRRLGEQGQVLLRVLVSANGDANSVVIERSSQSERLDQAAVEAVKKWRFVPAKKNNQPLTAYVLVPVRFSLDK